MRTFVWNDEYAVGEAEIDAQHRKLFTSLRELQLELYGDVKPEIVVEKIIELEEYCFKHFTAEVEIFKPYADRLPMYAEHMRQHKEFAETVDTFAKRASIEGTAVTQELCEYIGMWLAKHIINMDKETFIAVRNLESKGQVE